MLKINLKCDMIEKDENMEKRHDHRSLNEMPMGLQMND